MDEPSVAAVDWARNRGVYWTWTGIPGQVYRADSLITMLDDPDFDEPAIIVLEPAFEAYQRSKREAFIERARKDGHELRRITDRITPRVRADMKERVWGDACPMKSWTTKATWHESFRHLTGTRLAQLNDEFDTLSIWHAVMTLGKATSPVFTTDEIASRRGSDWQNRLADVNRQAVILRFMDLKPVFNAELESILGLPGDLDRSIGRCLGDTKGKAYLTFVSSCWVTAGAATTRDEYEAMLGLHQNGYASMLRSEIHHWGWRKNLRDRPDVTWTQYRRALRWLYHQLKAVSHPDIVE